MTPTDMNNSSEAEQKPLRFGAWVGACFTISLLCTSTLLGQGQTAKDGASTIAVGAFVTAMVCLAVLYIWQKTDSQEPKGQLALLYLGSFAALIGLVQTIQHYDAALGNYFLFISALGLVMAWLLPSDASRQRKQAKAVRARQESPTPSRAKP